MKNFRLKNNRNGFTLLGLTTVLSIAFYSMLLKGDQQAINSKALNIAIEDLDYFLNYNRYVGILLKNRATCVRAFEGQMIDPLLLSTEGGIEFDDDLGGGLRLGTRDLMVIDQKLGPNSTLSITDARMRADPEVPPEDLDTNEYATKIRFFAKRRGYGGALTREIKLQMTLSGLGEVTDCFGVIQQDEIIEPEYSDLAFCRMLDPTAIFDPAAIPPIPKCQIQYLGIFDESERARYAENYARGRIATHRLRTDRIIANEGIFLKRGEELHAHCAARRASGEDSKTEGCPDQIDIPDSSGGKPFGAIICDQNAVTTGSLTALTSGALDSGPPPAFITEDRANFGEYKLGCPYPYQLMDFTASSDPGSDLDGAQFQVLSQSDDYITVTRPKISGTNYNDYTGRCCRILF